MKGVSEYSEINEGRILGIPQIKEIPQATSMVIDITGPGDFVLALTQKGELFSWGDNLDKQCGISSPNYLFTPQKITKAPQNIIGIATGWSHSQILTKDGKVFAWGRNNSGEIKLNKKTAIYIPTLIETKNSNIFKVAFGLGNRAVNFAMLEQEVRVLLNKEISL